MKGVFNMILFTILCVTLLILTIVTIIAISVGGSAVLIVFGDVIVCIFIIGWIIKRLINKKKK